MRRIKIPNYLFVTSIVGTVGGVIILLKDRARGIKFTGEETAFGRTIVITGANSGIGKETARELAKRGGKVILACRDLKKGEEVKREIVEESANLNVHLRRLDLASLKSIREFADNFNRSEKRLDILINNAGVMWRPTRSLTEDGFEEHFGVNHLGHFLLTNLLLDKMKKSAPSRIINISSTAHVRGEINFEDLNSSKSYDKRKAYDQSKLANILFTKELSERLEGSGVTANAVHPGVVKTNIARDAGLQKSFISRTLLAPFLWVSLKTPEEGAQTTLYCALDPSLDNVSGKYFSDCKEADVAPQASDSEAAKRLWAISEVWTRLREL